MALTADVERVLFAFRGIDFHNKVGYDTSAASAQFASRSDAAAPLSKLGSATVGEGRPTRPESDDDQDQDSDASGGDGQTFVGGGKRSGIRRGTKMTKKKGDDSDSDFDL